MQPCAWFSADAESVLPDRLRQRDGHVRKLLGFYSLPWRETELQHASGGFRRFVTSEWQSR